MKRFFIRVLISLLATPMVLYAKPVTPVSWAEMRQLDYETGQMSHTLQELDGQLIEIEGFIVPLETDGYIDTVKEFLLVPNPLACIHVPPPPPNQMMLVTMKKAIPLDMDFRGVAIQGRLSISQVELADGFVSYALKGFSAKEANIEFDDPLMDLLEDELKDSEQ